MTTADDILSVNDAQDALDLTDAEMSAADWAALDLYVAAAQGVVQFYRGDIVSQTYTETHDGGDNSIWLRHTPVLTVLSMSEYAGSINYTLTNQPLGATTDAWGYTLDDANSGCVIRRSASGMVWRFVPGVGNVTVTYTTGLTAVPATARLAAQIILKHLWENRRGAAPLPLPGDEQVVTVPGIAYAIPSAAVELLEGTPRNPVFA